MKTWTVRALLALTLALPTASAGCLGPQTSIEQGQAPTTGVPEYDAFFKEVIDLRSQAEGGKAQAGGARQPLAKALGVDSEAAPTIEAAGERAKKLKESGVQLHLQLTPEPKVVRVAGSGGKIDADVEALLKAVEDAAKASLEVSLKLGGLPDKLTQLEKKRADLAAQTAKSFNKTETRRKVDREMEAAKEVIAEATTSSARYAGDASRFVIDLARVMETGGAAALAEAAKSPAVAAKPAKPVPKWKWTPKPGGAAAPPAGATPVAPPKPPPKPPAAGDDFDP